MQNNSNRKIIYKKRTNNTKPQSKVLPKIIAKNLPYTYEATPQKKHKIPELEKDTVRLTFLGGVEEVGRNMTTIEYNDDLFVVDAGIMFEDEERPGVEYFLPNTEYIEERKHKVRAMLITHAHLDHIGAIPFIWDRIGRPPIYANEFTAVMIKKRQADFPHLPEPDIRIVKPGEEVVIGSLPVTFFGTTHTIPDSMGIIIKTPLGGVVVTGDIKLDHTDGKVHDNEIENFKIFDEKEKNILVMMLDSTNAWKPGWSIPEWKVFKTFDEILTQTKGRLIIGTFASHVERVVHTIQMADKLGKKVVIEGRSMRNNVAIAQELNYLKIDPNTIITSDQIDNYPDDKIVILTTGAQGEEFAALTRIASGIHRFIKLKPTDTIALSSSVIPGNEMAVQRLRDMLARQVGHIITYQTSDIHASGHGNAEELKWIISKIKPKFFVPQHGFYFMLKSNVDNAIDAGVLPENTQIPENGTIIDITENGSKIVKLQQQAPNRYKIVEGMQVKDLQEVVINDRKALAQDGIFVIVATVMLKTGRLRKSPDIISRGFIYLRESKDLLDQARLIVKRMVEKEFIRSKHVDIDALKQNISKELSKFLLQQTHKSPIIIPVIVVV